MPTGPLIRAAAWPAATLTLIGTIALALRIHNLTAKSLWLDEIRTSLYSGLDGPAAVFDRAAALINQMPLYYLFVWALHAFGDGPLVLRLPAALFGTLAVLAIYVLGHHIFGLRVAVIAALLTAVSSYAVWYSQEARTYSLFMLLTVVQMYFAYRAASSGRAGDWAGLGITTVLNLYTHYFAIAATAAAATYVGAFLVRDAGRLLDSQRSIAAFAAIATAAVIVGATGVAVLRHALITRIALVVVGAAVLALTAGYLFLGRSWLTGNPEMRRRIDLGLISAAGVGLCYLPWLDELRVFLARPDQTVERLVGSPASTGIPDFLSQFGLSNLALATFLVGVIVLVAWLRTPRAAASILVLLWLAIPTVGMSLTSRGRILQADPRYFIFLYPAAALTLACGIEGMAVLLAEASKRFYKPGRDRSERVASGAAALLTVPLLVQAVPALADSYSIPKNDYRAAAMHIAHDSPPGSVVLALGVHASWAFDCFHYYLGQLGAPIRVVNGEEVSSGDVPSLTGSGGGAVVWGILLFPSEAELAALSGASSVTRDFVDVTNVIYLVRARDPTLNASGQAQALMRWETPQDPSLSAPVKLLEWIDGNADLGGNLVSALGSTGWSFDNGTRVNGETVVITPAGLPNIDAKFTTPIGSQRDFMLRVACSNTLAGGLQRVFALALDDRGSTIGTFPNGDGGACADPQAPGGYYFVFNAPQGTSSIKIVLRASGQGEARFEALELRALSDNG